MSEQLNPQHQAEATRFSDYIRERVAAGRESAMVRLASFAMSAAEWVGEKTEYEERDEEDA